METTKKTVAEIVAMVEAWTCPQGPELRCMTTDGFRHTKPARIEVVISARNGGTGTPDGSYTVSVFSPDARPQNGVWQAVYAAAMELRKLTAAPGYRRSRKVRADWTYDRGADMMPTGRVNGCAVRWTIAPEE